MSSAVLLVYSIKLTRATLSCGDLKAAAVPFKCEVMESFCLDRDIKGTRCVWQRSEWDSSKQRPIRIIQLAP